jgi:hypothetical protein
MKTTTMMKGGSQDENNRYCECHNNEKIRMMMITRMEKTSQDKGDGGQRCNNENVKMIMTKRMKRGSQDKNNSGDLTTIKKLG